MTLAGLRAVRRALAWLPLLAALVVACQGPGPFVPRASDRYEECDSAAGLTALEQARARIADGDRLEALGLLERSLAECPDHVPAHRLYVEVGRSLGGAAVDRVRSFYESPARDDSAAVPYARSLLADEPFYRQQLLEEALRRDPAFYWARLELAGMWRSLHRLANALEELDAALTSRPGFAEASLARAQVLAELGRYEDAARDYEAYLDAHPDDRAVQEHHARLLIYRLGRGEDAEPIVESLLQQDGDDVALIMDQAAIWFEERPRQALERYREVLEIDPGAVHAILNIGNLCFDRLGRGSEEARRRWWPAARTAYRLFLEASHGGGFYELVDRHFAVPFRLRRIESELGPAPAEAPTLEDLLRETA